MVDRTREGRGKKKKSQKEHVLYYSSAKSSRGFDALACQTLGCMHMFQCTCDGQDRKSTSVSMSNRVSNEAFLQCEVGYLSYSSCPSHLQDGADTCPRTRSQYSSGNMKDWIITGVDGPGPHVGEACNGEGEFVKREKEKGWDRRKAGRKMENIQC